jgi:hypothetical protein
MSSAWLDWLDFKAARDTVPLNWPTRYKTPVDTTKASTSPLGKKGQH